MRILLVSERYDPSQGGAERSLIEMAAALRRQGVEVNIAVNWAPAQWPGLIIFDGPSTNTVSGLHRFERAVSDLVGGGGYDVVHTITPAALTADLYQPRAGCLPALHRAAIDSAKSDLLRWGKHFSLRINARRQAMMGYEKKLVERTDCLICPVSRQSGTDFSRWYRFAPERLRPVLNGVDLRPWDPAEKARLRLEQRRAWRAAPGEMILLFIGHDFRRKGLASAIRAMAGLKRAGLSGWRLAVVGGDKAEPFQRLANRLGVNSRIIWAGRSKTGAAAMAAADLMALPTRFEPASRVFLEAMILGLPTVMTSRAGGADLIEPGVNGFLMADHEDADGVVAAMTALSAPGEIERISREASTLADHLHVDRLARDLIGLYQRIVAGRDD